MNSGRDHHAFDQDSAARSGGPIPNGHTMNQQFPIGLPNMHHPLAHMPMGPLPMHVPLHVPPPGQGLFGHHPAGHHPLLANPPHGNPPPAPQYMAMDPRLIPQGMFFNPSAAAMNPFLGGPAANLDKFHRKMMDGSVAMKGYFNGMNGGMHGMLLPGAGMTALPPQRPLKKARAPSAAAQERRRERNKLLARKTRVKKKAEMETLRDHVLELLQKNQELRSLAKKHLPVDVSEKALEVEVQLPENIRSFVKQVLESRYEQTKSEITSRQHSFCVINTEIPSYPIVYVSTNYCKLSGYDRANIIGQSCTLLQGPDTDKDELKRFREGLHAGDDFTTILLNYRKDGTTFWNKIELSSLRGEQGKCPFTVAIQGEISEAEASAVLSYLRKARNRALEQKQALAEAEFDAATAAAAAAEEVSDTKEDQTMAIDVDNDVDNERNKDTTPTEENWNFANSSGSWTPDEAEASNDQNNSSDGTEGNRNVEEAEGGSIPLTSKDLATRDMAVAKKSNKHNGAYSTSDSSGMTTNGTDTVSADGTSEGDSTNGQGKQFNEDQHKSKEHERVGVESNSKGSSECSSEGLSEDELQ